MFTVGEKVRCIKKEPWGGFQQGVKIDETEQERNPAYGEICTVSAVFSDESGAVDGVKEVITLEEYGDNLYSSRRFEKLTAAEA
jgi:hypothetical protein